MGLIRALLAVEIHGRIARIVRRIRRTRLTVPVLVNTVGTHTGSSILFGSGCHRAVASHSSSGSGPSWSRRASAPSGARVEREAFRHSSWASQGSRAVTAQEDDGRVIIASVFRAPFWARISSIRWRRRRRAWRSRASSCLGRPAGPFGPPGRVWLAQDQVMRAGGLRRLDLDDEVLPLRILAQGGEFRVGCRVILASVALAGRLVEKREGSFLVPLGGGASGGEVPAGRLALDGGGLRGFDDEVGARDQARAS